MAQLETWYKQDLKKPLVVHRHADVFNQDSRGNLIGVEIYSDGEPVTLSGSIDGYCLLSDGTTVSAVGANRAGNKASILIPQTAYNVPGPITITIKNTDGNDITTLCAVVGLVRQSVSGNLVQPGDIVTDWSQSINSQLQAVQDAADNVGAIVAAPFAENTAYVVGNYVTYNGNLYRITADHAAGVTWANTAKTQCTVGTELYDLKSALESINGKNDVNITNGSLTAQSVTAVYDNGRVKVYGQPAATRSWLFFNETWGVATSSSAPLHPIKKGKYKLNYQISGAGANANVTYTKTTFGNGVQIFDGDIIDVDAPFNIAVVLLNSVNYGTEENPTYIDISITEYAEKANLDYVKDVCFRNEHITINSSTVSQYPDCDLLPQNQLFLVLKSAITNGFANAAFDSTHFVITISGEGQIAFDTAINNQYIAAIRTKVSDVWQAWQYINDSKKALPYDFYPTGDDTNRAVEIAAFCSTHTTCHLAPGEYYFDTMVISGHLDGAGMDQTKLIFKDFDSSGNNYALRLRAHSMLTNLIVEKYQASGDITPVEDWTLGQNGIRIEGTGSDTTQRFGSTVENVRIRNFEGCGLYIANTGYNPSSGSFIHNVRVEFCSCGICLGMFAEFCTVADCWVNYCYTGHVILGANNTTTGCDFSVNKIGIAFPDNTDNNSHGIVQCCHIVHTGWSDTDADWNNGYIMKIGNQDSSEIIANCTFANGKILVKDKHGAAFFMTGCDIKKLTDVTADNGILNILSSFIANTATFSVVNGGVIRRRNCFLNNGTEVGDVT